MDTACISALSALGGATIGGLASFGSSWLTQLRFSHQAVKAMREALYAEFVDEASRLYGDALGHQKDDVPDRVKIYGLIGRIMLVAHYQSSRLPRRHWTRSFRPTLGLGHPRSTFGLRGRLRAASTTRAAWLSCKLVVDEKSDHTALEGARLGPAATADHMPCDSRRQGQATGQAPGLMIIGPGGSH